MGNSRPRNLNLNRETVRNLTSRELKVAEGGGPPYSNGPICSAGPVCQTISGIPCGAC